MVTFTFVALLCAVASCEEGSSYVYTARRFDPIGNCLEPYRPVEVLDGPGAAATCPEMCFAIGKDMFVTTMCPPLPPPAVQIEPDEEACVAARAAWEVTCGEDRAGADASVGANPDSTTGDE